MENDKRHQGNLDQGHSSRTGYETKLEKKLLYSTAQDGQFLKRDTKI